MTAFEEAVEAVFTDLIALPKDEFKKRVEEHRDGDIAMILRTCGYFEWNGGYNETFETCL